MPAARFLRTTSFRFTMLYAAFFSASVLVLFAVIYWSTTYYMADQLDASIHGNVNELNQRFRIDGLPGVVDVIRSRIDQMPDGPMVYLLQDRTGKVLAGNISPITQKVGPFSLNTRAFSTPGDHLRILRGYGEILSDGNYLLVAANAFPFKEMKEFILRSFALSFVVTLMFALGGGILMSGRVRHRVESINRTARAIMAGKLSDRIPVRGVDDEFDDLAKNLNEMLARTEASIESIRQVTNDIAHDLRTPLSQLRHRMELARHKSDTTAELHAAIDRSIADTDGILETFSALLRIAQLEGGAQRGYVISVDLSELLWTLIEIYQPTAAEKAQVVIAGVPPGLKVEGDRDLLGRMFANLIENAIRHSPAKATISVEGRAGRDGTEISIADNGPGIPPNERANVFRRFYRLEASRTSPGSGLGLSLVAAIAAIHSITVTLEDNHPGLRVRLNLPRSD